MKHLLIIAVLTIIIFSCKKVDSDTYHVYNYRIYTNGSANIRVDRPDRVKPDSSKTEYENGYESEYPKTMTITIDSLKIGEYYVVKIREDRSIIRYDSVVNNTTDSFKRYIVEYFPENKNRN